MKNQILLALAGLAVLLTSGITVAQAPSIESFRERPPAVEWILEQRLEKLLPELMQRNRH